LKREYWVLILLSIFLITVNLVWLGLDQRPPSWDSAVHLNLSLQYYDLLKHFGANTPGQVISVTGYYPPLYHLTTLPFFAALGASLHSGLLLNLLYLLILVWATYGIGKILYNPMTGLLSALVVAMYPFLVFISRTYVIDLPLTSMVTLGFYCYLRSDKFTRLAPSLLFGVIFGLGMLLKWSYLFFLIGPLVHGFWRGNKRNFCLSALVALVVASPWYGYNLLRLARYTIKNGAIAASEGDPAILTWQSLWYYAHNLLLQVQPVYLVLFIIGLVIFLLNYKKQDKILLAWIVIPYLILTLVRNKDDRYTLPFLAAVSIISCFWLVNIKNRFYRNGLITLLVLFSFAQFMLTSFGQSRYYYCQNPHPEDWQQQEVTDLITRTKSKLVTSVSVVANHSYWHSETLQFYADSHQLPILFKGYGNNLGQFADYVITKTGDLGPAFTLGGMPDARKEMLDPKSGFAHNFKLIGLFGLPDDTYLMVYKRQLLPSRSLVAGFSYLTMENKLHKSLSEYLEDCQDLRIKLVGDNINKAMSGQFEKVIITAKRARVKGIWLEDLKLEIKGLEMDLPLFWEKNKLLIYSMKEIHPEFTVKANSLQDLLADKAKRIQSPLVSIQHGIANVEGKYKNINLRLKFKISADDRKMNAEFLKVKVGMFTIPHWLYAAMLEKPLALVPTAEWPVYTGIGKVLLQDDKIMVGE